MKYFGLPAASSSWLRPLRDRPPLRKAGVRGVRRKPRASRPGHRVSRCARRRRSPILSTPEVFAVYVPSHAERDLLIGEHWLFLKLRDSEWFVERLTDPDPPSSGDAPAEHLRPLRNLDWNKVVLPTRTGPHDPRTAALSFLRSRRMVFVQGDGSLGWRGCSRPSSATRCPRRRAGSWPGGSSRCWRCSRRVRRTVPGVERPQRGPRALARRHDARRAAPGSRGVPGPRDAGLRDPA
jgi:hypothetical protein